MQMNFRKLTALFTGTLVPAVASAHPGHTATDLSAQWLQPFAGVDHFLAFTALTVFLLTALAIAKRARKIRQMWGRAAKAQTPLRRRDRSP
jgi:hydrogenase/urease accessory protein HupE